jgi:hypothetical protein
MAFEIGTVSSMVLAIINPFFNSIRSCRTTLAASWPLYFFFFKRSSSGRRSKSTVSHCVILIEKGS